MQHHRLAPLGLVIALALSIFTGLRAQSAELVPFKVGQVSPANTFLAIWVAQAAGLYEAQGLKVEVVPMVGGSRAGPDLRSGRANLIHVGLSSVVRANLTGSGDLRSIGSLSNVVRATMFTAPGVKTAADLKGGIVGISSPGSESDSATTLALRRLGLSRDDVVIKDIGVERFAAVRDGKVAATLLGEPSRSEAFAAGLNPIVDLYADRIPWLYSGLTIDHGYLREHRDVLMRFLRATVEGNYLAVTDAPRAKATLARELALTNPKFIDASYENFKAETPLNAEIDRAGAENVIATTVPPAASHKLDDYIDTSLTDALRGDGFYAEMARKYGAK
jgi:ABC-type nitrate/sulfonate/bicarbonate transport system substrate-binding protein